MPTNPWSGRQVRPNQEDLYKQVVLAVRAADDGNSELSYYWLRCAFDVVLALRPGYSNYDWNE